MERNLFAMDGKTVICTGGCGHLGKTMVKTLLAYGANVVVPSRTDRFDESYAEYRKAGKLFFVKTDLEHTEEITEAFAAAYEKYGKIDVLVNCAVYGNCLMGDACEYRIDKTTDEILRTDMDGTLGVICRCTREVLPYLEKNGGGAIVNVSSMYAMISPDFSIYGDDVPWNPPIYGAGKAGVLQFTRYCAAALARKNIRVNSLTPGPFPDMSSYTKNKDFIDRLSEKTMLKRTGLPHELSGALLLLCSDASSFITGSNIVVDGGMTQW